MGHKSTKLLRISYDKYECHFNKLTVEEKQNVLELYYKYY